MSGDYRHLAAVLAADIRAGRLRPGDRLPPQRDFAWRRGIAVSTASRVYAELRRRSLVTGEVGRGTFVRAARPQGGMALAEPAASGTDLELNFPVLPGQEKALAATLAPLLRPDVLAAALHPVAARASESARRIAARFLARPGFHPQPGSLLFTGNGKQAIAAALAALAQPGERIGVEALTYPLLKSLAPRLGIELVPLPLDANGLIPLAVAAAHRAAPLRGIYVQPLLHNPLGVSMGGARCQELADLLARTGIVAIEDAIYGFLAPKEAPLAAEAPDRTILVDSLSKRAAPGLSLGFVVAPAALTDAVAQAIRVGAWAPGGLALAASLRWMGDPAAARLAAAKRRDAVGRHRLARRVLAGLSLRGDPRAYHLLLDLPQPWRAEAFAAASARRGIAVTPASAFAVVPGHAPNAVRLALASPTIGNLQQALDVLHHLAQRGRPEPGTE